MGSTSYNSHLLRLGLTTLFVIGLVNFFVGMKPDSARAASHPVLITQSRIDALRAGGPEWDKLKADCDSALNGHVGPSYAAGDWYKYTSYFATCYLVEKDRNPAQAALYGRRALGMMKTLARDHIYGSLSWENEYVGLGNGSQTTFSLGGTPLDPNGVSVATIPTRVITAIYKSGESFNFCGIQSNCDFYKIAKISDNTKTYRPSDYRHFYREDGNVYRLRWLGDSHPAEGATYSITVINGSTTPLAKGAYSLNGSSLTLANAPATDVAIVASYMGNDYYQTGNGMGGLNLVQPDGPGYIMRNANVGLAYGFDLMYDFAEFTPELKQEFVNVLNEQVTWYKGFGYCHTCPRNNYYIRGYLMGTMYTAYGTDGANSKASEFKTLARSLIYATFDSLKGTPGGTTKDGQYAAGIVGNVLEIGVLWKQITGEDLIGSLEWKDSLIPAQIHLTKPDRVTFSGANDWSNLPARPNAGIGQNFANFFPDHPMAAYARQWVRDIGETVSGVAKDYKTDFPTAIALKGTGPVIARSDWGTNAIWWQLEGDIIRDDHDHRNEGSILLTRGDDDLIINAGGYGINNSEVYSTILFNGPNITYPPGQGYWGNQDPNPPHISHFAHTSAFDYAQSDFGGAYVSPAINYGVPNDVTRALRSVIYIRPGILVVHDQDIARASTISKIFNLTVRNPLTRDGDIFTTIAGDSKLFMKSLVPANPNPTIGEQEYYHAKSARYQTSQTGAKESTFLHVFEATDAGQTTMVSNQRLVADSDVAQGAQVTKDNTTWTTFFGTKESPINGGFSYSYTPENSGPQQVVLTDLRTQFDYQTTITVNGQTIKNELINTSAEGVLALTFDAQASNSVSVAVTPTDRADIRLVKSVDKSSALAGDVLTYKITYRNGGTITATNVKLQDIVPAKSALVSTPANATLANNILIWNIANLAPNASGEVSFQVHVE